MRKIIGTVSPVETKHKFYIYDDNNKIAETSCTIEEISATLGGLIQFYDTKSVCLSGPKPYVEGLAETFKKELLKKYSIANIEFTFI